MVYILRAGPPLDVSHWDSTTPSFSICLKVRYKVPGFIASNPKAAVRSMSSYPYEFNSRKVSRITGTSQFLGRTSTSRFFSSLVKTPASVPIYMYRTHIYLIVNALLPPLKCNASSPGFGYPGQEKKFNVSVFPFMFLFRVL